MTKQVETEEAAQDGTKQKILYTTKQRSNTKKNETNKQNDTSQHKTLH